MKAKMWLRDLVEWLIPGASWMLEFSEFMAAERI